MFKKLKNIVPKGGSNEHRRKVQTLEQMGFQKSIAENALDASNGNLEQATNLLLSSNLGSNDSAPSRSAPASQPTPSTNANANANAQQNSEEAQLSRAIQESLQTTSNNNNHSDNFKSAASIRAGQAAATRAKNASRKFGANGKVIPKKQSTLSSASNPKTKTTVSMSTGNSQLTSTEAKFAAEHPGVKIPKKLKDHSKLQQIMRCTKRLASHALAVDTLIIALRHIRNDPDNDKYRKINKSTAGYKRVLEDKPGVMDLLKAMNFYERHATMDIVLERSSVDHALLYMGISALEEVRETEDYLSAKRQIAFLREVKKIQDGANVSEDDEVVKRAEFISKCPTEPTGGAGALLQVKIGEEMISRRFDGDDIVNDIVNWIGGHGSAIPSMIMSRDWSLVDLHRYPVAEIDTELNMDRTLQYIGCWPSGKLEIRPSTTQWKEERVTSGDGSSRGLGAAHHH
uniref:UBA domain-containing protein n=1 Tax=Chaetoceros debilis TaxID=122233 RepID=A0A7S3V3X8_9STRA|mmetsp:Transcript_4350/g.6368  ORF Transcript_4350/g.6368 Transcript_4350/m.6368 type:complete len:458 (+) Transcript_4350:122-1495(+)